MQDLIARFAKGQLLQDDRKRVLEYLPSLDIQTIIDDSSNRYLLPILDELTVDLYSGSTKSKLIQDYLDIRDTLVSNHSFIILGYLELIKKYGLEADGKNNAYLFIFMYLLSKKLNDHIFCQQVLHKSIMLTDIENYQAEYKKYCHNQPIWKFRNGLLAKSESLEDIVTWYSINGIELNELTKVSKQCYISEVNARYVVPEHTVLLSKQSPFTLTVGFA